MRRLIMLSEIKTNEIMTARAAMEKYRTKYFLMVITEVVDQCDNDLGYVIYTADNEKELIQISEDEFQDKRVAYMLGVAAEPFPIIGGVVYHD